MDGWTHFNIPHFFHKDRGTIIQVCLVHDQFYLIKLVIHIIYVLLVK